MKQISFSNAEFTAKKKVTRRERFLMDLDRLVPWTALASLIEPYYPRSGERGRPPMGLERMLRMYVAQNALGLSDEGIEDAIYDSGLVRRFVGVNLAGESAPDATTLLKFRRLLEIHALTEHLFTVINAGLESAGLLLRKGTIVDATQTEQLLHGEEEIVFADAGYTGVQKRDELSGKDIEWQIAAKRGAIKRLPEGSAYRVALEALEKAKASMRAKVEHPFHVVKNLFRHRKVRYKGLAKNEAQMFTLFGLANLMLARRQLAGIHGRGAF